jgi:hypothetical protein
VRFNFGMEWRSMWRQRNCFLLLCSCVYCAYVRIHIKNNIYHYSVFFIKWNWLYIIDQKKRRNSVSSANETWILNFHSHFFFLEKKASSGVLRVGQKKQKTTVLIKIKMPTLTLLTTVLSLQYSTTIS